VIVDPGVDFKGWSLNRGRTMQGSSRGNRIGVRGSEDLGGGLRAVYQIELGIETANSDDNI
jgi:predicted porin